MSKFKIGDRVRILSWKELLKNGEEIWDDIKLESGVYFCNLMKHLCGREATISDIVEERNIFLSDWSDGSGDLRWSFTDEMIEKVDEISICKPEIEEFVKYVNNYGEERKGSDNMEIINLYYKRKNKEIEEKYNEERKKIIENDEIQKLAKETVEKINKILENEEQEVNYIFGKMEAYTKDTQNKIAQLDLNEAKETTNLYNEKMEVEALLELTEDYSERIQILKNYGIINKDGKVNNK